MSHDVIMPALGMAQDTGRIVAWLKLLGDPVADGEPLFEVETDKAVMEVPASSDGFLSTISVATNVDVAVGTVIAQIVNRSEDVTSSPLLSQNLAEESATTVSHNQSADLSTEEIFPKHLDIGEPPLQIGPILASPKARKLAKESGLDLARLRAQGIVEPIHVGDIHQFNEENFLTGPKEFVASPSVRHLAANLGIDLKRLALKLGRTTLAREDVLHETRTPNTQNQTPSLWDIDHAAYGPVTKEPMSRVAVIAGANLTASNSMIPQVTNHDRANISAIEALRGDLKPEAMARGIKLTALAFQVMALAATLREFPKFNASLTPDGKTLVLKGYVHIGIAVDTEHGLMVPVIRNADSKGLWEIAVEITDLARRARTRKIGPDDMGGGSMTITNLGGIGGTAFTPIVNAPEVAILGLTRTEIMPVWDGKIFQPVPMLPLDLSYDHRVINGAEAARFLTYIAGLIADPFCLIS